MEVILLSQKGAFFRLFSYAVTYEIKQKIVIQFNSNNFYSIASHDTGPFCDT